MPTFSFPVAMWMYWLKHSCFIENSLPTTCCESQQSFHLPELFIAIAWRRFLSVLLFWDPWYMLVSLPHVHVHRKYNKSCSLTLHICTVYVFDIFPSLWFHWLHFYCESEWKLVTAPDYCWNGKFSYNWLHRCLDRCFLLSSIQFSLTETLIVTRGD